MFPLKGIQAFRIDFFFILKVANNRCFILIAVELFIISYLNSLERRKYVAVLIFLPPVKNSMLLRAIFTRPDCQLIRESVCACAKLFVDKKKCLMYMCENRIEDEKKH